MSNALVECVPNFSEAQNPAVIAEISKAIESVKVVHILDTHSDTDHNRTVITFSGPPEGVEEAAYLAISKAAELINMDKHEGEHPRIGATDVFPFVPISGITMAECVDIAKRVGEKVGTNLHIPVYLYEEAATIPERKNLAFHRKGEYEGLKQTISQDPKRRPDYGPRELGKAGAVVIGARSFLIAFNVYLSTTDVKIAKKIAKSIRHSSGGFRFVKALGLMVDGKAQVSMNLTNYEGTSIPTVVEFIRREAQRYGVAVESSELVGLMPQEAVVNTATWYTQMEGFTSEQILEKRLYDALSTIKPEVSEEEKETFGYGFLDELASDSPTPGGGSAAAFTGAIAASLVAMVARLTLGKKKYSSATETMKKLLSQAMILRQEFIVAATLDAAAFERVMAAYRLPKESAGKKQAIEEASFHAAKVPLDTAENCISTMEMAVRATQAGNINAITDSATAGTLAYAAMKSAGYNVKINLADYKAMPEAVEMLSRLKVMEARAENLNAALTTILAERGGLPIK